MRYWWVNHKQTFRHEFSGGYIWSPKTKRGGAFNRFYETMREVAPGDVIFSYAGGVIRGFGIAKTHCYTSPRPDEFGHIGEVWDEIGWRADIGPRTLEALARHEPARHPITPQRQQAEGDAARQLTKKCRVVQTDVPINELRVAFGDQHAVTKRKVTINVVRWIGHHYEMNARRKRIPRHCLRARNERRIVKRCPDVAGYDQRRARRLENC